MAISSLGGELDFVSLNMVSGPNAPPLVPTRQVQPLQRGGVEDTTFVNMGIKGQPFQMISFRDADDLEAAFELYLDYVANVGVGPLALIWSGIDISALFNNTAYVVLDVIPLSIAAIRTASGGLSTNKGADIYALWTLMPVEETV